MSNVIDGKRISQEMLREIEQEVKSYSDVGIPGLAVVQVGGREDSNIYIKKKQQACMDTGMSSTIHNLDIDTNDKDVCELIERLNDDSAVNGILVQLPLPSHLNDEKILSKISYLKDVDGFHSRNMGDLAMDGRTPSFAPCTPSGCIELLRRHNIEMMGKHAVVVGKSNIVGLPMALLLMKEMATVTVCHIETKDIRQHLIMADIVVSACGQAQMIKREWLKEGVVVIDVGINSIPDATKKRGYRLVGDVDFENVKEIARAITPVPGGVGPMTVTMLLRNTLEGFKRQNGL